MEKVLRIKEVMKEKGISRVELAEMIDTSLTTISNITSEHNMPSVTTLLKIAEKLDVDVRDLFVPTKPSNIEEARQLIEQGLEKLKGSQLK
jgi:transcriptional regulator with XRE-family HTH domain